MQREKSSLLNTLHGTTPILSQTPTQKIERNVPERPSGQEVRTDFGCKDRRLSVGVKIFLGIRQADPPQKDFPGSALDTLQDAICICIGNLPHGRRA